jgi:GntR family transcriptional repressor for pyruvate dehydrogenase complex
MAPRIDTNLPTTNGRSAVRKAHEVVADQLRQQIVSGELTEGQRLPPEEELTAQFGVARTTLREALRVLESQGLIAIKRGRGGGPLVTHPSVEPIAMALAVTLQILGTTIGDLDAARQLIEPQIAGRLAAHHTDDELATLTAAVDVAADAADRGDGIAFGLAAAAVHETLITLSGNNTLTTIAHLLQNMVQAYYLQRMDVVDPALMQRAVRSYRKLITLIRDGDVDGATENWLATMQYTIGARDPDQLVVISPGA